MVVAQVRAVFAGGGLVERRNFDFAILLAVMAMLAVEAVEEATGGLI